MENNKAKKRRFTLKEVDSLCGQFEGDNYGQMVRMVRQDIKDFKMDLHEAAAACRMNHVSPYDVFLHDREKADQVVNELLHMRSMSKLHAMGQTK